MKKLFALATLFVLLASEFMVASGQGVYFARPAASVTGLDNVILATQPSSLKGYWKCDETSGTTLVDSSGTGNDLALTGGYTLNQSGLVGASITFNGTSGYASRSDSVLGNSPSAFTIFALAKVSSATALRIFSIGNSADNDSAISIQASGGGGAGFHRADAGGANSILTGGGPFVDNSWHMICFRLSGGIYTLFIDGTILHQEAAAPGTTTLNRTAIGALLRASASNFWPGSIQHVAVWDTALTDNEVDTIFDQTGLDDWYTGPFSITLTARSAALGDGANCQGVAFDGTHYYFSTSTEIFKYTRSGNVYTLVDSHDYSAEWPVGTTQINGLNVDGGFLWAGSNNYAGGTHAGNIIKIDPSDLSYVDDYSVGANYNEGGAWHDVGSGNEFWAVAVDLATVRRYSADFTTLVGSYTLPFVEGQSVSGSTRGLYQGACWLSSGGNHYLLAQTHSVNPDNQTHIYQWNGTGFTAIQVINGLSVDAGQGLAWETEGSVILFAERGGSSSGSPLVDQTILRASFTGP